MRRFAPLTFLTLALPLVCAAGSQIDQIERGEGARASVTSSQIDPDVTPAREHAATEQASARQSLPADAGHQLAPAGQRSSTPSQLYTPRKTAEPAPALTERGEGRNTRVVPLAGHDRCDSTPPAPSRKAKREWRIDPDCGNVIETRASEFTRGDPLLLSPEQKLLADQPSAAESRSIEVATRRLGNDGLPIGAIEQGVAATAYAATRPVVTVPEKPDELSKDAAAISAVLGIIGAPAQN